MVATGAIPTCREELAAHRAPVACAPSDVRGNVSGVDETVFSRRLMGTTTGYLAHRSGRPT
jgi:hypothetical protein